MIGSVALGAWIAAASVGCGGASARRRADDGSETVGRSRDLPVDWTVYDGEGVPIHLERMRGRVLLVWVFATYDFASNAMIAPLNRLVERRSDQVRVIGVAVQPNARQLLPLFGEAMRLRFPIAWDPEGHVLAGASPLGPIDLVPTIVVLDRNGYRLGARPGALGDGELGRMVDRAIRGDAP